MAETRALPLKRLTLPKLAQALSLARGPRRPGRRSGAFVEYTFAPEKRTGRTDTGARKIGRCSL